MGQLNYNTNDYAPSEDREVIPAGIYDLIVKSEELKDMASGNGKGLSLIYEVIDGPHKGAGIFHWINIEHIVEVTQRIGRRELKSLQVACGIANLNDSSELVGKIFKADIDIEPEKTGNNGKVYAARNVVKKFHKNASEMINNGTTAPTVSSVAPWAT